MMSETQSEQPGIIIAKFDKERHDRSAFTCGFSPIDRFLKLSLSDQVKAGFVTAWCATFRSEFAVVGFYTLNAMVVRSTLGPRTWQHAGVPDIPVIYIRAVAVHRDWQGRGIGTALLIDALRRSMAIADQVGSAAVVLDVLDDADLARRKAFYTGLGFRPLGDPENAQRVYLPMADIRATLRS